MELPDIGNHCAFDGCSKLDFLAIRCKYCLKQFCADHGNIITHKCLCIPEGGDPLVTTDGNVPITTYTRPDRGSAQHVYTDTKKKLSTEQQEALDRLRNTDRGEKTAAKRPKQPPPRKSPKIELMRLKAKATGNPSINMDDRVYLCVQHKEASISVFINKRSVVGNAAAQLAKQMRLSMLPDKVYRLYKPGASEPLPSNKPFDSLVSTTPEPDAGDNIYNGCTLELKC